MGYSKFEYINIKSIAGCVPKDIQDTMLYPYLFSDKEKKKFIRATGIRERRIAEHSVTSSDLGYYAAIDIITGSKIDKKDIKSLIFVSQTPDYRIPFTANILQHRLDLDKDCTCIDINAGCSGFVTGLQTAYSIQNSLHNGNVLLIFAETMSKIVSSKDRATSLLFGDGATALLLEKSKTLNLSFFSSFSDGKFAEALQIPDSGYRNITSKNSFQSKLFNDGSERNNMDLFMDGPAVFDFTMREVIPAVKDLNTFAGMEINDFDYIIFHQSNKFIINQFGNQLKIPLEKLVINIDRFGNTSGVSIPLAIVTELFNKKANTIHISGYGAGLSWGNAIIKLTDTKIFPLKEV
jgi:3-oxoacyl-[acyl-carrier-protein] synthase-3